MRCAPRTSCVQLAMAWSKPAENKKGGGVGAKAAKGGGKGGKGSKEAAGQGKGQGSTPAIDYSRLAAEMLKQKSVAKQEQGKEQGKHDKGKWCCPCGFADNFAKRDACFKCGLAKGQPAPVSPPGLGPQAAASEGDQVMQTVVEMPLEEKIRGIQGDIKWMKMSPTSETKAQVAAYEAELQKLLDQQKRERPLPARLQAATARDEKAKAAQAEAVKKVAGLEEQLRLAKLHLEESNQQAALAAAELQAVKQTAGEDLAAVTAASMVAAVQQVLARVHDPRVVQEMVETIKVLMANPAALQPPPPPQQPEAAAAAAAQAAATQAAERARQQQQAADAQAVAAHAAATQLGVEAGQQLLDALFRQQAAMATAAAAAATQEAAGQAAAGMQLPGSEQPQMPGRGRSPARSEESSAEGEGTARSRSERKRQKKAAKQARLAAKGAGSQ